jgi:hypothetical protein
MDAIHDKGNLKKHVLDTELWSSLFRRLTVRYYETARHHLKMAKQMDEFMYCTEHEILQEQVLKKFVDQLSLS